MFNRKILSDLDVWSIKNDRKPLVLRGARQVGKTTAINLFSRNFDRYINLNLDKEEDRSLFEMGYNIDDLISAIFLNKGLRKNSGKCLIFIDEIQNSPKAISQLRYFYENANEFYLNP